jgi:ferredoxin
VIREKSKNKIGRRLFLRVTAKALAGAVGGGVVFAESVAQDEHITGDTGAKSFPTDDYDWTKHRWAYGIDATRCIGCLRCVEACKTENAMIRKTSPRQARKASIASIIVTRMPMSPKPFSCRRCATSARTHPASRSARWGRPSEPRTASY